MEDKMHETIRKKSERIKELEKALTTIMTIAYHNPENIEKVKDIAEKALGIEVGDA